MKARTLLYTLEKLRGLHRSKSGNVLIRLSIFLGLELVKLPSCKGIISHLNLTNKLPFKAVDK